MTVQLQGKILDGKHSIICDGLIISDYKEFKLLNLCLRLVKVQQVLTPNLTPLKTNKKPCKSMI